MDTDVYGSGDKSGYTPQWLMDSFPFCCLSDRQEPRLFDRFMSCRYNTSIAMDVEDVDDDGPAASSGK